MPCSSDGYPPSPYDLNISAERVLSQIIFLESNLEKYISEKERKGVASFKNVDLGKIILEIEKELSKLKEIYKLMGNGG